MRRCGVAVAALVIGLLAYSASSVAENRLLNEPFFPLVQSVQFGERTIVWSEIGSPRGRPLVFAVGFPHAASTGAGVLSPYDDYLRRKNIRLIAVERTGATNRSSFDIGDTLDDYVSDLIMLTDHLSIDRFTMMAFSAGGPGAIAVAAQMPDRVTSLHLVSARGRYTEEIGERTGETFAYNALINDPLAFAPFFQSFSQPRFFLDPADVDFLDTHFGSNFLDFYFATAISELDQNPDGLSASRAIAYQPWSFELAEVVSPVFVYQGWDDQAIFAAGYPQDTPARVRGPSTVRFYPAESHFRTHLQHFDQLVADMTHLGRKIILCVPQNGKGKQKTREVSVHKVANYLRNGATIGNCLWQ